MLTDHGHVVCGHAHQTRTPVSGHTDEVEAKEGDVCDDWLMVGCCNENSLTPSTGNYIILLEIMLLQIRFLLKVEECN